MTQVIVRYISRTDNKRYAEVFGSFLAFEHWLARQGTGHKELAVYAKRNIALGIKEPCKLAGCKGAEFHKGRVKFTRKGEGKPFQLIACAKADY